MNENTSVQKTEHREWVCLSPLLSMSHSSTAAFSTGFCACSYKAVAGFNYQQGSTERDTICLPLK